MVEATSEFNDDDLQNILKQTLQDSVSLAKKRIRSKKGLSELQAILIDYHQNKQLAIIIRNVIRLISNHETSKREDTEESPPNSNDQYKSLEEILQKYEASVREHIRNEQQLKLYSDQLQEKNKQLIKSNQQLLKSTKQTIVGLKRESQKLLQENHSLSLRIRELETQTARQKQKDELISNTIKKVKRSIEAKDESGHSHWGDRYESSQISRGRRSSISSIRHK